MSLFASLAAVMDATVDSLNAEAFAFQPMRVVRNGAPVVDTGRDAVAVVMATFEDLAAEIGISARRSGAERAQTRASSSPEISVLERHLPQGVRQGDVFTRAATGKAYRVVTPEPDGMGRLFLGVVET